MGHLAGATAARTVDARDSVVAPGFIDMHSHASWNYLVDSRAVSKLTQGITLEVEGEGQSVAPVGDAQAPELRKQLDHYGVRSQWRSLADFFRELERHPATINFSTYLGTGTVRQLVVGLVDRPATPAELERMRAIVATAMREGALGVYSALRYTPDRFNRTSEIIEMAKVAAEYGGVYQTHPRSEADALDESMDEVFRIAREAKLPAQITHLKVAYEHNWGKMSHVIERIDEARRQGLDITADMYPYEWAGGSFTDLLPPWVQDGGREAIIRRLKDRQTRERVKQELAEPTKDWENEFRGAGGGPAGLRLLHSASPDLQKYAGQTLKQIAEMNHQDPRDAMLDIILAGDGDVISLIVSENDIRSAMREPWVAFGTDGSTIAPDGPLSQGLVHPRAYGTFPRVFGRYVRELKLLTLEEAVRRATSLAAQRLNLRDRGMLRIGSYADVVIFDPDTIADTATYEKPHQIARGVNYVLVNGRLVLENGKVTAARPGRVVRGPGYQPGH
jgi:dihydroorotase/N-acyl-D-amino-acid deacylase